MRDYRVVWDIKGYDNKDHPAKIHNYRQRIVGNYVMFYNKYAYGFDFKRVNDEFDRSGLDKSEYETFVRTKAQEWVDKHINKGRHMPLGMYFRITEEMVFEGYNPLRPEDSIHFHLE